MGEIERLRSELSREKAKREVLEDFRKDDRERKMLKKELKSVKFRRKYPFLLRAGKYAKSTGRGLLMMGKDFSKKLSEAEKRRLKNNSVNTKRSYKKIRDKDFSDILNLAP